MSDYYLGEIRMFSGFRGLKVPQNWAPCDGRLLQISGNEALYSLLGTRWGGDGATTFAIPNLNGRVPIGQGTGTGLTSRTLGQTLGAETVTLTSAQLPSHNHTLNASSATAATTPNLTATGTSTLSTPTDGSMYYAAPSTGTTATALPLAADTLSSFGSSQPHDNLMPGIGVQYMIALLGTYPVRP